MEAFIGHSDPKVRECFAESPHIPAEIRSRLAEDPDFQVRWALAAGPQWERFQPRSTSLTEDAYDLLAYDARSEIRCELAQNWQTPAPLLIVLAMDPAAEVRRTVCSSWQRLPPRLREALLDDADQRVRRAAQLKGYRDRPELLGEILATGDVTQIAGEAQLPRALAEGYARSGDAARRHTVAENPYLGRDLVEELATDPDPGVRLRVSLRPELTEAQRAAIDYDPDLYQVRVPLPWIRERFPTLPPWPTTRYRLTRRCDAASRVTRALRWMWWGGSPAMTIT
ncbi:hypothetical protein [Nonomuraea zeae]|uniref:Leucine rich repeat variant n=1 Tax=Nonomuraea zeae TaxID=1642303 RepID=A0A5S4FR59_9ACTN|nr:hypothetical protein [Nonomuraea zeae]TMR23173.1 hypothetical protein ETD85_48325 [Nonomuraea zeae]